MQINLFNDPKYVPRSPEELEAEAAEAFEENVEKVRAMMDHLRRVHICGVGHSFAVLATKIGTSEEYVREHADAFAKRLRLENSDGHLWVPDHGPDPADRLAEAVWHGTVDGEAFDGDPADLW